MTCRRTRLPCVPLLHIYQVACPSAPIFRKALPSFPYHGSGHITPWGPQQQPRVAPGLPPSRYSLLKSPFPFAGMAFTPYSSHLNPSSAQALPPEDAVQAPRPCQGLRTVSSAQPNTHLISPHVPWLRSNARPCSPM